MSNDNKALADVQPGGRVRLGDQAERARFEAWGRTEGLPLARGKFGGYAFEVTAKAWRAWQYLSAQPSPGGQDALAALQQDYDKLLDSFNRQVEVAEKIAGRALQQDDRIEELEEALAARQPVGEPFGWWLVDDNGIGRLSRTPPQDTIEIYRNTPGYMATPLYAAPPAQAVDLGAVRALLQRRIDQWRSHLPADPGAPGTREIETNGEHDYNNDVRIYREGIAVMEDVLSKIDSQAVGNG